MLNIKKYAGPIAATTMKGGFVYTKSRSTSSGEKTRCDNTKTPPLRTGREEERDADKGNSNVTDTQAPIILHNKAPH